jgi:hypothetical protein
LSRAGHRIIYDIRNIRNIRIFFIYTKYTIYDRAAVVYMYMSMWGERCRQLRTSRVAVCEMASARPTCKTCLTGSKPSPCHLCSELTCRPCAGLVGPAKSPPMPFLCKRCQVSLKWQSFNEEQQAELPSFDRISKQFEAYTLVYPFPSFSGWKEGLLVLPAPPHATSCLFCSKKTERVCFGPRHYANPWHCCVACAGGGEPLEASEEAFKQAKLAGLTGEAEVYVGACPWCVFGLSAADLPKFNPPIYNSQKRSRKQSAKAVGDMDASSDSTPGVASSDDGMQRCSFVSLLCMLI